MISDNTRYFRLVLMELAGTRRLYRSGNEMKGSRELKPLKCRAWYKSQRGGSKISLQKDYPEDYIQETSQETSNGRGGARKRTQRQGNQTEEKNPW